LVDGIDVVEYQIGYSTSDSIPTRIRKFLRFGAAATKVALKQDYDLIFATSTPLTAAVPGILARLIRSKPFVFEVRDLWPELPKALGVTSRPLLWAMGVLEWLAYHTADRVIGLAPGIIQGITKRGIPVQRTVMIPNGCDLDLFRSGGRLEPDKFDSAFVSSR
jgi:glycosyltransferase involved in cell wall biosynthesis